MRRADKVACRIHIKPRRFFGLGKATEDIKFIGQIAAKAIERATAACRVDERAGLL